MIDKCHKYHTCLKPIEYYVYVEPSSESSSFSESLPSYTLLKSEWSDPWTEIDGEDMKTWSTIDYNTYSHAITVEWREADNRKYYVQNNSYCVGTITNGLKGKEGERQEINAY